MKHSTDQSNRLSIANNVSIPLSEIEISAIRSQGAGGQNVNKVATGIHLRFDISRSSLPLFYKERLMKHADQRITSHGQIIIKAQTSRSQEKNREAALSRLATLVRSAVSQPRKRRKTSPTRSSQLNRLDHKRRRGQVKTLRKKVTD